MTDTSFDKENGTGGTTDGTYFHSFSGRPLDQYTSPFGTDDPRDHIGSTVSITVRAELTAVVTDHVSEGTRETLKFKVLDSKTGTVVAKADKSDPNQTSIDDVDVDEDTDYGDSPDPDDVIDVDVIDDPDGTVVAGEFGPNFSEA